MGHYDEHCKAAAGRMKAECHAELLKAEAHVGTEYHQMAACLAVSETAVQQAAPM